MKSASVDKRETLTDRNIGACKENSRNRFKTCTTRWNSRAAGVFAVRVCSSGCRYAELKIIYFTDADNMSATERERHQKSRLQHFLSDLAILGPLQGFYYFQPRLRGKEELLLNVINEDLRWPSPDLPASVASSCTSPIWSSSCSVDSDCGSSPLPSEGPQPQPRPQSPQAFQQQPSRNNDLHLLPASPSEREMTVPEFNHTLFLLAGYAKYGRPYAWIRSNHERLMSVSSADSLAKDAPVKLKSITDWVLTSQGTRVWDVVNELVTLCTMPPPDNPFSLDMLYLQSRPLAERFLATGALLNFLEMIVVQGGGKELFYDLVVEEIKSLRQLHFQSLAELLRHRNVQRKNVPKLDSAENQQSSSNGSREDNTHFEHKQ